MITISKEDYLKEIYNLSCESRAKVSTSTLAEKLSVSNAAISEMAKKLHNSGLVTYEKYKGVKLTGKGKRQALKIIRRHRLWESFLMDALGLSWSEVHAEAEKLEHQTSDFLIDRIDEYLNHPKCDPHGHPIPQRDGKIPAVPQSLNLTAAEKGNCYTIVKVVDENKELMDYLTSISIGLNTEIKLIERLSFDNSILVVIGNSNYRLSEQVASKVFVTLNRNSNE